MNIWNKRMADLTVGDYTKLSFAPLVIMTGVAVVTYGVCVFGEWRADRKFEKDVDASITE